MKITNKELDDLMIELVRKHYGAAPFARRDLMDLTEEVVSELGRWEDEDDLLSGSKGKKSRGLAYIDYRFSPLKLSGQLLNIAHGFWMLSPEAASLPEGKMSPARKLVLEWRIIRDTSVITALKKLYKDQCQCCQCSLKIGNSTYSEGHHLKPLGSPHDGDDVRSNILILCPNCHVAFDYFAADFADVKLFKQGHKLEKDYVNYYKKIQQSKK